MHCVGPCKGEAGLIRSVLGKPADVSELPLSTLCLDATLDYNVNRRFGRRIACLVESEPFLDNITLMPLDLYTVSLSISAFL